MQRYVLDGERPPRRHDLINCSLRQAPPATRVAPFAPAVVYDDLGHPVMFEQTYDAAPHLHERWQTLDDARQLGFELA
ncbi:hypothetical protein ACVWWG_001699 [Bradyrhizobium sp. LB7.2]